MTMEQLEPKYEVSFRTSEGTYVVRVVDCCTSSRNKEGLRTLYYTDTDMERIRIPGVIECSRMKLPGYRKHAEFNRGKTLTLLSMRPGDRLRLPLVSSADYSGWASICTRIADDLRDIKTGRRTRQWKTDSVTYPGEILIICVL